MKKIKLKPHIPKEYKKKIYLLNMIFVILSVYLMFSDINNIYFSIFLLFLCFLIFGVIRPSQIPEIYLYEDKIVYRISCKSNSICFNDIRNVKISKNIDPKNNNRFNLELMGNTNLIIKDIQIFRKDDIDRMVDMIDESLMTMDSFSNFEDQLEVIKFSDLIRTY